MTAQDFLLLLPEAVMVGVGLILLLLDLFSSRRGWLELVAVAGTLAALGSLWVVPVGRAGLGGLILSDGFGMFFRALLLGVLLMVELVSMEYVRRRGIPAGEFLALLSFATAGAMLMSVSIDLVSLYIGLELLSLSSYVLAGLLSADPRSGEASLKYFLNGALSSALFLFGVSVFYGVSGSTDLGETARSLREGGGRDLLSLAALFLVLAGVGFKLGMVPFHLWVPDTYEGAPTPVSAFLSVGSKAAALAAFLRLFFWAFEPLRESWMAALGVLSLLTMVLGNTAALHQRNVKRMLGYSSISHVGYILAGLAAGTAAGFSAALYYAATYAFMTFGAFAVLVALSRESLDDLGGLARREPVLAFLTLLFMLSLLGIPPLGGFWAKLFVFRAAVEAGLVWLAVAVALNSVISIGYYYRVIRTVYAAPLPEETGPFLAGFPLQLGLALAAAGVVLTGLFPDAFLHWAEAATFLP